MARAADGFLRRRCRTPRGANAMTMIMIATVMIEMMTSYPTRT
jgi:hypothetical protein